MREGARTRNSGWWFWNILESSDAAAFEFAVQLFIPTPS